MPASMLFRVTQILYRLHKVTLEATEGDDFIRTISCPSMTQRDWNYETLTSSHSKTFVSLNIQHYVPRVLILFIRIGNQESGISANIFIANLYFTLQILYLNKYNFYVNGVAHEAWSGILIQICHTYSVLCG